MNILKKTCTSCLGCMKNFGEGVVDTCIDNTFCQKCVSDKYRIKHVLKSVFRFKNIEVNEGQWYDFSDEYIYKFHKHSNIKVAIENANFDNLQNTLNLFNLIYKNNYIEYWIFHFGLIYDDSWQQTRTFFPLNEKISLTSIDDIVELIYDAEKTFGEKIVEFYKGQAMDEMDILRWQLKQRVKISDIIGDTVLSKQKTDIDINNYSVDIQSLWIYFLKQLEHNPEDITNKLEFIHKFNSHYNNLLRLDIWGEVIGPTPTHSASDFESESDLDIDDDGYYHEGHESGQHPAFTGKETADKEIVRQGINEPSIASDIYAPGGMEQLRLRTRAVPKVQNMNRGGKRRKKTRKKKKKRRKKTRRKKKKRKKTRRKRGSGHGNKINNKKKIKKKNKIHKTKKKGNRFNSFLTRKLSPNYLKHTISSLSKIT